MKINTAYGAVINVPVDYATIQTAVDAANDGDTILVASGTYNENIYIPKPVSLVGEDSATTIIYISHQIFFDDAGIGGSISGFTISGSGADKYANIYCWRSTVTITNNIITKNEGNGISCGNFSSLTIANNIISENGGGISCNDFTSLTIINNIITENGKYGISCWGSCPTITNNIIALNGGDAIICSYSTPDIINNTIVGNKGRAFYCINSSSPTITNNIIANNTSSGIFADVNSIPKFRYNNIWGNATNYVQYVSNRVVISDNISADPLFIDAANSDFHLQCASPCINTGTNTATIQPMLPTDKDGNPRPYDGGIADMGAYEYQGIVVIPPSNLATTIASSTQVNLRWTDNSDNEDGFKIERKVEDGSWQEIATVGANVTTCQDTELIPNATYYYRVRAYNIRGTSNYSNEVSATTIHSGKIIHFPNPCYPNKGEEVRIVNIPQNSNATVYIYDIAGELVRVIEENKMEQVGTLSQTAHWNAKNGHSRDVACGVYIYLVKYDGNRTIGKVAIIR